MTRRPPPRGRLTPGADSPRGAHRGAPRPGPGHRQPKPGAPRRGLSSSGRSRSFVLLLLVTVAFTAIGLKLVVIQGVHSDEYLAAGGSEWEQAITLPAERGSILDRNGDELAMSIPQTTIYADPHQVSNPVAEATALAPILSMSAAHAAEPPDQEQRLRLSGPYRRRRYGRQGGQARPGRHLQPEGAKDVLSGRSAGPAPARLGRHRRQRARRPRVQVQLCPGRAGGRVSDPDRPVRA